MAILAIKNLSFKYNESESLALSDIELEINSGEFVVLCGESGCGKSTLLRLMKKQLAPKGKKKGGIYYNGVEIDELTDRMSVTDIGFVMQNPDNQIVTDKVWHELAFGLESLGEHTDVIRRKVAEICGFFGITDWFHKKTTDLSGGQKQLLNLASIMLMRPKILILDEPTSQLDPIASNEFISTLLKLNRELGLTIILVEHRLEEVFPVADRVIVMNKAQIYLNGTPKEVGAQLGMRDREHKMQLGLPTAVRIYNLLEAEGACPLTVREGKDFISLNYANDVACVEIEKENLENRNKALEIDEGWFRYEREHPDILKGLTLSVYENEILFIMGANGSGKTTTLKILSGLRRLYRGKLRIWGKKLKEYSGVSLYRNNIASLPQNPQSVFLKNTLQEDLMETAKLMELKKEEANADIETLCATLEITNLLGRHPLDLSGGEQQKAALAKILLLKPRIILLDEPTKGIDAYSKKVLAGIFKKLKEQGKTIVVVSHDVEFAAETADRCAMFFDGQIVSVNNPVDFFAGNTFYTTATYRMTQGHFENAVTAELAVQLCRINGKKNG